MNIKSKMKSASRHLTSSLIATLSALLLSIPPAQAAQVTDEEYCNYAGKVGEVVMVLRQAQTDQLVVTAYIHKGEPRFTFMVEQAYRQSLVSGKESRLDIAKWFGDVQRTACYQVYSI